MDAKFHPAIAAIESDDLETFRALVHEDPTLAVACSSTSHPTLLQCLVLSGKNPTKKLEMARLLIQAGAELNGPLVACGSCDNVEVAGLLLDSGADADGGGSWSPLEESLYWNSRRMIDLLVRRGAAVQNLRIASGLGRAGLIEAFFNSDGSLKPEAGKINWPFGNPKSAPGRMTAKASLIMLLFMPASADIFRRPICCLTRARESTPFPPGLITPVPASTTLRSTVN
jgi:hypothetical protein